MPTAPEHLLPKGMLRRIGVSRVARVTELDTTGVEVACAVRPHGHVLQVSQGKGVDFASAVRSAAFEAAELFAAEQGAAMEVARARELPGDVWAPSDFSDFVSTPLWNEELRLGWLRAQRLDRRGTVWVPAQLVVCPPPSVCDVGPIVGRWTSNGLGAHVDADAALQHGIGELLERDALSAVLPDGWLIDDVGARRVSCGPWQADLTARGFGVAVFELTRGPGWPPVAGALLMQNVAGPVRFTSGYACRPTLEAAIDAAIREAAQSRLTDIHGAREDITAQSFADERIDIFFQLPIRAPRFVGRTRAKPGMRLAMVELPIPGLDVTVVKVLSPDARVSALLS